MGFLRNLKNKAVVETKKTMTPPDKVYYAGRYVQVYRDDESLPRDFNELYNMDMYYRYGCKDKTGRENRLKMLKKAVEFVEQGIIRDPKGYFKEQLSYLTATPEDIAAMDFDKMVQEIRASYVTAEMVREKQNGMMKDSLIPTGWYYYKAKYDHDSQTRRVPELIDAIWSQVEKEKSGLAEYYIGYYLYTDLIEYFRNDGKKEMHLSYKMWNKAKAYASAAHDIYDNAYLMVYMSDKKEQRKYYEKAKLELANMRRVAKAEVSNCRREEMQAAYHEFCEYLNEYEEAETRFLSGTAAEKVQGGVALAKMIQQNVRAKQHLTELFADDQYDYAKFLLCREITKEGLGDDKIKKHAEEYVWKIYSDQNALLNIAKEFQNTDEKEYRYFLEAAAKSGNAEARELLEQEDSAVQCPSDGPREQASAKKPEASVISRGDSFDDDIDALFDSL